VFYVLLIVSLLFCSILYTVLPL